MIANIVQIAGVILIGTGAFLVSIPAGFIVSGVLTVLLGISLERE